ncbi:uncharacterized protein BDV17DRAFT_57013 [Aspergillus undulatus]|uniref:uncharacterized protein n=1 Tax=Aspergillus undulatus TaxID=1810928 RepID=UPI003CCD8693
MRLCWHKVKPVSILRLSLPIGRKFSKRKILQANHFPRQARSKLVKLIMLSELSLGADCGLRSALGVSEPGDETRSNNPFGRSLPSPTTAEEGSNHKFQIRSVSHGLVPLECSNNTSQLTTTIGGRPPNQSSLVDCCFCKPRMTGTIAAVGLWALKRLAIPLLFPTGSQNQIPRHE